MAPRRPPKSPLFWEVVKLEKELMELPDTDTSFTTNILKSMGIERAPQLDIDNPNAVDAYPVFFQPLADSRELGDAVAECLREGCCWSHCPDEASHIDRVTCATHAIGWIFDIGSSAVDNSNVSPIGAMKWHKVGYGPDHKLPRYSASHEYLVKHGERPPRPLPEWFTPIAFCVEAKGMYHAGCFVADTTSHKHKPDEALRSEITTGVSFIRRQIQFTGDTDITIPVIVFSFYHNDTVRITQMCWNGERNPITFRQSRLLNIASDSFDTPDILLLLRWMECIPLREPRVARRQATAGTHAGTPKPSRPVTPLQNGTAQKDTTPRPNTKGNNAVAAPASTTTAPTLNRPGTPKPQAKPGLASEQRTRPGTPEQRRPGAVASESKTLATTSTTSTPRAGTTTPRKPTTTGSPPRQGSTPTPHKSGIAAATSNTTASGGGHGGVGHGGVGHGGVGHGGVGHGGGGGRVATPRPQASGTPGRTGATRPPPASSGHPAPVGQSVVSLPKRSVKAAAAAGIGANGFHAAGQHPVVHDTRRSRSDM
ncbi:hypothetical protein C8A00DRAFT_32889 [Chaetomidium leptoderma]|uniref:Uncharacterized protein n=1 Tax=Chaetomidium leptoderma TaxID=669021 RepID=A0AAN6ZXD9_9PEZI|nr:hypothetical protein C8A00DRAFT_32889 [Chaetomidium leptoderma]